NFYDGRQPENVCAVTGTSGKSSAVDFCRQMWGLVGKPALSAGTIGIIVENVYSEKRIIHCGDSGYTTPVSDEMYKFLGYFKDKGVEYGALEMSSHGLDQHRLANIRIKAAGFTNLGTDHMDFYGGYKGYLDSKAKLFRESVDADGTAVLNADIPEYEYLRGVCLKRGLRVWSYGRKGAEFKILSQSVHIDGQSAEVELFGKRRGLDLKILGEFQLGNMLCALGMFAAVTPEWEAVLPKLGQLRNALGRLEYMGKTRNGSAIYIDFSYKGDALEHTLKTLRSMAKGKIVLVFSTCGDVYETRRREELGRAAQEFSDIAILTDDSPRFEDAQKIRDEVLAFCPKAVEVKTGRKDAIRLAFETAGIGDVVLVAGKGHEDYFTVGDVDVPYTDQQAVRELLDEERPCASSQNK
ncbi:MAG: UDP-N-acetylmuramyl-tripeptide synthetase, partial [Rickettsiales bacterium]|nr:UDP-N-acetylmuramyl-tripeptide synthetase [Rickettsiales bacterium]